MLGLYGSAVLLLAARDPFFFATIDAAVETEAGIYLVQNCLTEKVRENYGPSDSVRPTKLSLLSRDGELKWEWMSEHHHLDHDVVMLGDSLLFCDEVTSSIKRLNLGSREVDWEWKIEDIDFSRLDSNWDDAHYFNNKTGSKWGKVGDLEIRDRGNWTALLFPLIDFSLILEINLTSALERQEASNEDITWFYHGGLLNPYDVDYLDDQLLITDTNNKRLLLVDFQSKRTNQEILFSDLGVEMHWCRDADRLPNGNYLFTDSTKVFEYDPTKAEIGWLVEGFFSLYKTKELTDGNLLVVTSTMGELKEIDRSSREIRRLWGQNRLYMVIRLFFVFSAAFMLFQTVWFSVWRAERLGPSVFVAALCLFLAGLSVFLAVFPEELLSFAFSFHDPRGFSPGSFVH
jgi:hypothetical protein